MIIKNGCLNSGIFFGTSYIHSLNNIVHFKLFEYDDNIEHGT